METFIGCYYITWIISVSFNSFLHGASINWTFIIIPVNHIIKTTLKMKFYVSMVWGIIQISEYMQAILIAIVFAKAISLILIPLKSVINWSKEEIKDLTDQKMKLRIFFSLFLTISEVKTITNLGFGLFFTIFFPYFLHLNPSSSISTSDFVLNATLSFTGFFSLPLSLSPSHTQPHKD